MYPENKKYFGLSEFIESTLSGHSLPLLRYDSSFEAMVTALGKRYPSLLKLLKMLRSQVQVRDVQPGNSREGPPLSLPG